MRAAAVAALAVVLTACGGNNARHESTFMPGAFEPTTRVTAPLPGRRVALRSVPSSVVRASVRELLATGHADERLPLYVARDRAGFLCIGSTGVWRCLRPEDAQPAFSVTLQGGHGAIRDWGAVAGIAAPDVRVTVERDRGEVTLSLRRFPRFAWAAFASPVWHHGAPNALHFYDRAGRTLSGFLDLAFSADPCPAQRGDCTPRGKWHHIGDPLGEASGGRAGDVSRAERVAFADPLVRDVLAGRRYSFDPATDWRKCKGGRIGVVLSIHFPPATLEGDWPSADYDEHSHTAYVQHVSYYKVRDATQIDVSVDLNRGKVVGVDPTGFAPDAPEPKVNPFSFHPVGRGVPGGGPDSGDCGQSGD